MIHPTAKVPEGTNRNMPAGATFSRTATLRASMHSVTDRQSETDNMDWMMPIADHTVWQYDPQKINKRATHGPQYS